MAPSPSEAAVHPAGQLVNALAFHRWALGGALQAETRLPRSAKIGGAVSLGLWVLVMLTASLNVEGPPKVLLTGSADTSLQPIARIA